MWELLFLSLCGLSAATTPFFHQVLGPKIIDLSYPYDQNTPYWNFYKNFSIETFHNITKTGIWLQSENYETASHGGTHMDAPRHFAKEGWTLTDIPLNRLIAPGVLIDVTPQVNENRDYQLTVQDIQRWEHQYGKIPDGSVLLIRTGWDKNYPDIRSFYGLENNNWEEPHFPGIHPETAAWLVKNRKLYGVGLDSSSLDYGPSKSYESHQILLAENIYGLEVVANLKLLPPVGFTLYVMPMKLKDASGAPTRVFAIVP